MYSLAWYALYVTGLSPAHGILAATAGALTGGIAATTVDMGLVENTASCSTPEPWRSPSTPAASGPRQAFVAVVTLIGLVVTVPLWILISVLIWLEEPGPVFSVNERVRFRTTKLAAEPRTLLVGWMLRRSRLDELPRLTQLQAGILGGFAATHISAARRSTVRICGRLSVARLPRLPAGVSRPAVRHHSTVTAVVGTCAVLVVTVTVAAATPLSKPRSTPAAPLAAPMVFDPAQGSMLPHRRVVAFYGVPGADVTGPAYTLDAAMLDRLRAQGAEYERLDPAHPVVLGIDLVASVPDSDPGPTNSYSHRLDRATLDRYVEFCRANGLLLFLDLSFGWTDPQQELGYFLPYLALPFVHLAIDPEWMFPRHNGVPGVHLSNVRAADLNPIISTVAELPTRYRVPRKIVIIHQYRPTGDGLPDPYAPGQAEIADKRNLVNDPRVDLVVHVDSVGGWPGDIEEKTKQYGAWVGRDMARFGNFQYGGFKIFYQLESKNRLMTPKEVMALQPPPMVVTYGN
ncbi:sugar transferase [Planosporangium mesophilum]|uniref:sugar transferase n=1 Tax=Planosporangium mesophilum TaxID=689768 RepID=UPI001439C962|nr:sugar transferase [Planosporangium mesophilum]NJC82871.1 hypothetical protein [Planosporangium mesophilum]